MVKLLDNYETNKSDFEKAGIKVPEYDQDQVIKETEKNPLWWW